MLLLLLLLMLLILILLLLLLLLLLLHLLLIVYLILLNEHKLTVLAITCCRLKLLWLLLLLRNHRFLLVLLLKLGPNLLVKLLIRIGRGLKRWELRLISRLSSYLADPCLRVHFHHVWINAWQTSSIRVWVWDFADELRCSTHWHICWLEMGKRKLLVLQAIGLNYVLISLPLAIWGYLAWISRALRALRWGPPLLH